jgi:hypothetical protein
MIEMSVSLRIAAEDATALGTDIDPAELLGVAADVPDQPPLVLIVDA